MFWDGQYGFFAHFCRLTFSTAQSARAPRDAASIDQRKRKARNQKAWRARDSKRGRTIVCPVAVSPWLLEVMIEDWGCVQASESEDRAEVGKAISALLEDAALHKNKP
jgi:hypothetical protein